MVSEGAPRSWGAGLGAGTGWVLQPAGVSNALLSPAKPITACRRCNLSPLPCCLFSTFGTAFLRLIRYGQEVTVAFWPPWSIQRLFWMGTAVFWCPLLLLQRVLLHGEGQVVVLLSLRAALCQVWERVKLSSQKTKAGQNPMELRGGARSSAWAGTGLPACCHCP